MPIENRLLQETAYNQQFVIFFQRQGCQRDREVATRIQSFYHSTSQNKKIGNLTKAVYKEQQNLVP